MRVIFLDFNGVISGQGAVYSKQNFFNRDACKELARIVRKTDAKIVLSTSWRTNSLERLDRYRMELYGLGIVNNPSHVIGETPFLHRRIYSRGDEILKWIKDCHTDITNFVILDDKRSAIYSLSSTGTRVNEELNKRYVRTNSNILLTKVDGNKAIGILNKEEYMNSQYFIDQDDSGNRVIRCSDNTKDLRVCSEDQIQNFSDGSLKMYRKRIIQLRPDVHTHGTPQAVKTIDFLFHATRRALSNEK